MLEWNVFRYNMNKREIEIYNIFRHGGFRADVVSYLHEIEDREKFEKELKASLMYYFWLKCEWEILLSPWPRHSEENKDVKIDVCQQVMNNWQVFVDYVWKQKESSSLGVSQMS